jgi:hemolysin activation/secretion protein
MSLGFDVKSTNNNLSFGGVEVFAASQQVDQFVVTYDGSIEDGWGITSIENNLNYSPGNLTGNNTDAAFAQSGVTGAHAKYVYDTLSLTRATRLPFEASWVSRLTGQWASTNLLSSEQLGGGGEGSVRGYDPRTINGSEGFIVNETLRAPPVHPLHSFTTIEDSLQFFGFWDYARLNDPSPQAGTPAHSTLASAGAGFDYSITRRLDIHADYGWQLLKFLNARSARADLSITLSE